MPAVRVSRRSGRKTVDVLQGVPSINQVIVYWGKAGGNKPKDHGTYVKPITGSKMCKSGICSSRALMVSLYYVKETKRKDILTAL